LTKEVEVAPRTRKDTLRAKEIGARIKQARHEAGGMTQRELAELVGVTERSIAGWEAGNVIPFRWMRLIEDAVARPAEWILYGEKIQQNTIEENQSKILAKLDEVLEQQRESLARQDEILAHLKGQNDGAHSPPKTRARR
jgi:DNA-binding XRE family transcriptional regulator